MVSPILENLNFSSKKIISEMGGIWLISWPWRQEDAEASQEDSRDGGGNEEAGGLANIF